MATSTPFSLRLDPELRTRLEAEAKQADRSASYMAAKAIKTFLDAQRSKREAIATAISQTDAGDFISSEKMSDWVNNWGTDNEQPDPKVDITKS
ncbi:MAG: hypothetical protein COA84_12850 [Robiginitomaculum sp.]|nr:MAG: hypothetical protein COA84_12850 [Robiginitomaculum sp.]